MSTTQIPPPDPSLASAGADGSKPARRPAPPPPPPRPAAPHPSGGEIYDRDHWETAYRNSEVFDAPKLLIQMEDELARSRHREALWFSVFFHVALGLIIWFSPLFLQFFTRRHTLENRDWMQQKDATFIELPPDAEHVVVPPKTNIISDKNRVATNAPQPDQNELKKLREMAKRGALAQEQQPAVNTPSPQTPSAPPEETPKTPPILAQAPPPPVSPKQVFGGSVSASSAVEQAARAAAENRGGYGGEADSGYHRGGQAATASGLQVLSDTMGVDFDPYLKRVLHDVRVHWYELIPESAMPPISKQGRLSIQFAILKDGRVNSMKLTDSSSDVALDRASWGGITGSNPFPPLPADFKGEYLMLRFTFYYNPPDGALLR